MKLKFFTIPALDPEAASDELNVFLCSHKIVAVQKELITSHHSPLWSVVVSYLDGQDVVFTSNQRKPTVDYKKILSEADFVVYAALRELRKTLAEQEGIPPYAVFTNEQLAHMVKNKVTTKAAMHEIPGIGDKRVEKFADLFLERLVQTLKPEGEREAAAD